MYANAMSGTKEVLGGPDEAQKGFESDL